MTRRRYVQDPVTFELIEVTDDYQAPVRESARNNGALWNDRHYDGVRATDGTDISTRKKHRDYMRATGLTTADDFSSTWAKQQEQRQNYYKNGGSFRRADVERAMYEVNNRKR
jgi:hypothetical protein